MKPSIPFVVEVGILKSPEDVQRLLEQVKAREAEQVSLTAFRSRIVNMRTDVREVRR